MCTEVKVMNHYGKYVFSDTPVTGVISNNTPEFLMEELNDSIDLDYIEFESSIENDDSLDDDEKANALEMYESMGDNTLLIGDWIQDDDGKYDYNPDGEYAAIMRESVTQVVYSKFTRRGALCSPCYPGQVDLDSPGEFLAYDLPRDLYGDSYPDNDN